MTRAQLFKLFEEHYADKARPKTLRDEGHKSIKDAVMWFVAWQMADEIIDSYSHRDMAHLVKDGMPAMTIKDVDNWLEAWEGHGPRVDRKIKRFVREFLGDFPKRLNQ
jgi:hypothetical protein